MALTDKSKLKKYFRSGSRPTQSHFEELIDNCYNGDGSVYVSGYSVMTDIGNGMGIASLVREAGKSLIIPSFDRINIPHKRTFHYAIPTANIGDGTMLETVSLEVSIPQSAKYKIRDKSKEVGIRQDVKITAIRILNGDKEIHASGSVEIVKSKIELEINKSSPVWRGISIDIEISYDIVSEIAVSDQLDIATESQQMLLHTFGIASCIFKDDVDAR